MFVYIKKKPYGNRTNFKERIVRPDGHLLWPALQVEEKKHHSGRMVH